MNQQDNSRLLQQADANLGQGRFRDAIDAYRKALASTPEAADAWFNLGYALRREGEFETALDAYAQALARGASAPEQIHLNRAVIFSDHLRNDDAAETELRHALAIAPGFASAWLNLGNLHEERGKRASAIECYERILALPASQSRELAVEALARLVHLRAPQALDDPLLAQLRRATQVGGIDDVTRANLHFSLGRAFDTLGEPRFAFAAFSAGKVYAHRRYPAYDPARAQAQTAALMAAFPAIVEVGADVHFVPEPVFVCGMFRSGSTLLEQVLAAHPSVASVGELELLPRMTLKELAPFPQSASTLAPARFAQLAAHYHGQMLTRLPADAAGKRYATDKRPDNYQLIGLIKRLFPRAKIVHTRRNPADNALSIFMQHLNPQTFGYSGTLAGIGHHFGQYERLMRHWKALYPDDIFDFDYDAFIADPETTLRPLLQFLGLEWNAACLQFHKLDNTVKTASYWQVRRPLYGDASGRWKRYREFLDPLFTALADAGVAFPAE